MAAPFVYRNFCVSGNGTPAPPSLPFRPAPPVAFPRSVGELLTPSPWTLALICADASAGEDALFKAALDGDLSRIKGRLAARLICNASSWITVESSINLGLACSSP
jgi:hypothetical protein